MISPIVMQGNRFETLCCWSWSSDSHLQILVNRNVTSPRHCHHPTLQMTSGGGEIQPPVPLTETLGYTDGDFVPPQPDELQRRTRL